MVVTAGNNLLRAGAKREGWQFLDSLLYAKNTTF
jgi:hypothetical protein